MQITLKVSSSPTGAGKFGSSFGQNVNFGGVGGVIPHQGMGETFFTEYYFSENEMK